MSLYDPSSGGVTVNTSSPPQWNGVSLTKLYGQTFGLSGNQQDDELWYLVNPAPGTNTITVNFTGQTQFVIGAEDFYNVNQTLPFGTVHTASPGDVSSVSNTVNSGPNQLPIDVIAWSGSGGLTKGGSQTQLWYSSPNVASLASSYAQSAGSTTTLTWSDSGTDYLYSIGVSLQPAAAGPPSVKYDNASTIQSYTSRAQYTNANTPGLSLLIGSNTNRAVFATVEICNSTATSVTYNGTTMTNVNGATLPDGCDFEMYYLLIPDSLASGTYNFVVNDTGNSGTTMVLGAVSYYNVASIGSSNSATGASTPASVTVSGTNTTQLVVDSVDDSTTANTGQTGTYNNSNWGDWQGSYKQATASTTSMGWTSAGAWGEIDVAVNPTTNLLVVHIRQFILWMRRRCDKYKWRN